MEDIYTNIFLNCQNQPRILRNVEGPRAFNFRLGIHSVRRTLLSCRRALLRNAVCASRVS